MGLIHAPSTGGGGSADAVQMLSANDGDFDATIGNWITSAGTITRDTGTLLPGQNASGKFDAAAGGDYAELPLGGTFKAGVPYIMAVIARQSVGGNVVEYEFGVSGVDSAFTGGFVLPLLEGHATVLRWIPTVERTSGVSLRVFNSGGGGNIFILAARLYQAPESPVVHIGRFAFIPQNEQAYGYQWLGSNERSGLETNALGNASISGTGPDSTDSVGISEIANSSGNKDLYYWAEHVAASLARHGHNIQVGADYLGFFISEKNATTIQIYDDATGAYNIEFVEQAAGFHFKFIHVDGGIAIPALGMLPRYAAAPHSGIEQEGESYYDTVLHKARTWDGSAWQNHF